MSAGKGWTSERRAALVAAYQRVSNLLYGAASAVLMLIALCMVGFSVLEAGQAFARTEGRVIALLDAISLIVIAMAVFDVGKYLMDEEVLRERELSSPAEARRALTKFLTILIIAVSLEALMFVFDAGKQDVSTLIYPTGLLLAVALLIAGLGAYQRLSKEVEQRD